MSHWLDIGAIAEMKFEPGAAVKAGEHWLAVFRVDDGFRVIDNACPHAGAPLADGSVLESRKVACFLHCWEFDLDTGQCDVGEEWNVRTYPSRVVDGRLEVELPDPE
ncbi:MAG: Rieske 2Fe-2S domain-containing protein [bacterium]|nr:Rieske 2Fe-2S domain-containing protein [bacterium]